MTVSKFIWFWQLAEHKTNGWWVDGGIWPRLRIVRKMVSSDIFELIEPLPHCKGTE